MTRAYRQQNYECALIIAADPARYPGLMAEWAAMILGKDGRADA